MSLPSTPLRLLEISRVVMDGTIPPIRRTMPTDSNLLVHILAGTYTIDGPELPRRSCRTGESVVYPQGTQRRLLSPKDGSLVILLLRWVGGPWQPVDPLFLADPQQRIGVLLRRLDDLTELPRSGVEDYRLVLVQAILHELRWLEEGERGLAAPEDPVARLRVFIDQNPNQQIDLAHLTARFGAGRATLCRRFRQRFGTSPMAYLQQVRLKRVLDLLAGPDPSLPVIARQVGLRSPQYLAQFLRRHTGRSLRAWRREARRI